MVGGRGCGYFVDLVAFFDTVWGCFLRAEGFEYGLEVCLFNFDFFAFPIAHV